MKTRVSTLSDVGDLDAPPGTPAWAAAVRLQVQAKLNWRRDTENHLRMWCDAMRRHTGWRLLKDRRGRPFATWEAFCRHARPEGLGMAAADLHAEEERRELQKKGTAGPGRGHKKTSRNTRGLGESDTRDYILARLERDGHAELIARVHLGELSAHQAALQVGYRKALTAFDQLKRWWGKTSPEDRLEFLRWACVSEPFVTNVTIDVSDPKGIQ